MSDFDFPPDSIDEQTGLPADGLPPEEARLIADLHRVYHPIADSSARSLERVQALLAQREARLPRSRSAPASTPDFFTPIASKGANHETIFYDIHSKGAPGAGASAPWLPCCCWPCWSAALPLRSAWRITAQPAPAPIPPASPLPCRRSLRRRQACISSLPRPSTPRK